MSLTAFTIAKLSGVDKSLARRACAMAAAMDEANGAPPDEFRAGPGARCYALAVLAIYRPALFWGGLVGVAAIPVLLVFRVLH